MEGESPGLAGGSARAVADTQSVTCCNSMGQRAIPLSLATTLMYSRIGLGRNR